MHNSKKETQKRLAIASEYSDRMKTTSVGIILVGSVAYAPNDNVRPDSGLDLIIINDDLQDNITDHFNRQSEIQHILTNDYDGYQAKDAVQTIPVSYHQITKEALTSIANAEPGAVHYYRPEAKGGNLSQHRFRRK
jgi:hypothetical protein